MKRNALDDRLLRKCEREKLRLGCEIEATVRGTSMAPAIRDGEIVVIRAKEDYRTGDILMFDYRGGAEFLFHRLVGKDGETLLCKGDNSYRLEEARPEDVWGAAIYKVCGDRRIPLICPPGLPEASLAVNRLLVRLGYDRELLGKSELYLLYREKYLGNGPEGSGETGDEEGSNGQTDSSGVRLARQSLPASASKADSQKGETS